MDERKIRDLMELGASRATAVSALRAAKGDSNEAAMLIYDDRHLNAVEDALPHAETSKAGASKLAAPSVGKGTAAEPMVLDDSDDDRPPEVPMAEDDDDEGDDYDDDEDPQVDFFGDADGDDDGEGVEAGADPFAQLTFQKDRKETVIEVEEVAEKATITLADGMTEPVVMMPQGEWMKGCPEGTEQSFLFQIYNRLTDEDCRCPSDKCRGVIKRRRTDFFVVPNRFSTYLEHLKSTVQRKCPVCSRVVCLACGEEAPPQLANGKTSQGTIPDRLLHCPDLQAVILGVGLSMVESKYYGPSATSMTPSASANSRPAKKTKMAASNHPEDDDDEWPSMMSGPPASKRAPAGIGYGGASSGQDDQTSRDAAIRAQRERDSILGTMLSQVRDFLPNRERKGPFRHSDHMPSIATAIHLRRRFNPIASELLRNDSLSDMSDRRILYSEFLAWLEIMAAHENLCAIMGQAIMRVSSVKYSARRPGSASRSSTPQRREKTIVYEGSAGPRELLEGILRQVKAAKHAMSGQKERDLNGGAVDAAELSYYHQLRSKENEEVEKLEAFCNQFVSAVKSIDTSLRNNNKTDVLKALKGPADANAAAAEDLTKLDLKALQDRYVAWAEKVRYGYYDFEVPLTAAQQEALEAAKKVEVGAASTSTSSWSGPSYTHAYSKDIQAVYSYPSRNTAIAREHSTLSSSLPVAWDSSVFLRVDESRPDVMKALITGPEGTPYSNGCFIFDIFLGSSYNQKAPSVKTMTTKGGRYRLNPNLYADGKVCLSLLGTWSGPGWIPGKSTLLQVIISIQSMILCEEPYLNEPGWASMSGTAQSKAYNKNVRRMVIDDAMIGSLKNPNPAFADIIRTHYRLKAPAIRQQLDRWLAEDDGQALHNDNSGGAVGQARVGQGTDSAVKRNVTEMKRLLALVELGQWPVQ